MAHKSLKQLKEIREKLGEEHLQNHKLQCSSIPDGLTIETYSFQRECQKTFAKAKTSCKRKSFAEKNPELMMTMQLDPKGKKLTESRARDMILSICFIRKK